MAEKDTMEKAENNPQGGRKSLQTIIAKGVKSRIHNSKSQRAQLTVGERAEQTSLLKRYTNDQ